MGDETRKKGLLVEGGASGVGEDVISYPQSHILIKNISNNIFCNSNFNDTFATKRLMPYVAMYFVIAIAIGYWIY